MSTVSLGKRRDILYLIEDMFGDMRLAGFSGQPKYRALFVAKETKNTT